MVLFLYQQNYRNTAKSIKKHNALSECLSNKCTPFMADSGIVEVGLSDYCLLHCLSILNIKHDKTQIARNCESALLRYLANTGQINTYHATFKYTMTFSVVIF